MEATVEEIKRPERTMIELMKRKTTAVLNNTTDQTYTVSKSTVLSVMNMSDTEITVTLNDTDSTTFAVPAQTALDELKFNEFTEIVVTGANGQYVLVTEV